MVGDFFFPGYLQESGNYACFFALPYHMSPKQFAPELIAEDRAGNQRRTDFYHHANPRSFPLGKINLDERFLKTLQPRFEAFFPEAATPLELFLKVNGELRKENVRALRDFGKQTASGPLWEGVFLRQPNAAHLGGFAAARSYFYEGKKVDDQTHMGVDLASVAQAPIPAANAGKVVHADDLGIYGKCIIIDHGMGLQSLYGHLSRIDVEKGETVAKGQTIGNSGATGLAGGDHLHFEIILSGLSVNPVEWWDPAWLKNNVGDKLSLSVAK
jgi:murein DD-endopeptidase MepM/ murein hydrolase activator NlpD